MALGLGLGLPYSIQNFGLKVPKNLRITSTTATTISYAWDASAGVDGYQFGIYEDSACTILIDLITIMGASTTTYTWDMTFFNLATNYFSRVIANGDSSITSTQRSFFYTKFKSLVSIGVTPSNVDRLWCDKYCYTPTQALTAWIWNRIGTDLATAFGSPTFTTGVGWTHTGTSYISPNYTPSTDSSNFKLNNAGIYHSVSVNIVSPLSVSLFSSYGTDLLYIMPYAGATCYIRLNGANMGQDYFDINLNNYQVKITTSSTGSVKFNGFENNFTGLTTSNLQSLAPYRCARNLAGTADIIAPINTIDKWLCLANSSLDKDLIETALA